MGKYMFLSKNLQIICIKNNDFEHYLNNHREQVVYRNVRCTNHGCALFVFPNSGCC